MKSVVRLTDHLDMTLAVDWDVKEATQTHLATDIKRSVKHV